MVPKERANDEYDAARRRLLEVDAGLQQELSRWRRELRRVLARGRLRDRLRVDDRRLRSRDLVGRLLGVPRLLRAVRLDGGLRGRGSAGDALTTRAPLPSPHAAPNKT